MRSQRSRHRPVACRRRQYPSSPVRRVQAPKRACQTGRARAGRVLHIRAMTERGMAHADGAPACPFVADTEDDRDERSDRPDHRHRCYAEVHPAPRAMPTRRRTACRVRLRSARPSRNGRSGRPPNSGRGRTAVPPPGRPSRSRRATNIVTTRRPNGCPKARSCATEGRTGRRMAGTAAKQPRGARRRPRALAAAAKPAARLGGAATVGNRTGDE